MASGFGSNTVKNIEVVLNTKLSGDERISNLARKMYNASDAAKQLEKSLKKVAKESNIKFNSDEFKTMFADAKNKDQQRFVDSFVKAKKEEEAQRAKGEQAYWEYLNNQAELQEREEAQRAESEEEYQKYLNGQAKAQEKEKAQRAKGEKAYQKYINKQAELQEKEDAENKKYTEKQKEIQEKENKEYSNYMNKLKTSYEGYSKYGSDIEDFADKFNVSSNVIVKALGNQGISFDKSDNQWKNRSKHKLTQEELNSALTKGIRETKRFDTASLGLMFAGMALNRAMTNLTATSREWVGISELMSTAMGVTMLPATLDLLNFGVLPLFDAFTSLPEPAQKAIGYLTYALGGLGAVLMVGGQLSLGLQSFDKILGRITGIHVTELMTKGYQKVMANLGSIAKYAGAALLFSLAFKDGAEGQFVAALGDILMGAGILVGGWAGGVIGAIGFTAKFLGDEDFRKGIWKSVIWGIDTFMWMIEQISTMFASVPEAILTGNWSRVWDAVKGIGTGFKDEIAEASAEMFVSGDLKSQFGKETGYNKALETYGAKTSEYSSKYGWGETTGVMGTETLKQIELNEEIGKLKEEYKSTIDKVNEFNTEISKLDEEFAEGNIRQPEYNKKVEELKIKYADSLSLYEIYNEKLETLNTRSEDLATAQKEAYDAVNNYTEAVRIATEEFNKEKKSEEYESTKKNKNSFNAGGQVGLATGATIGATIGSIFPGVGTVAGAAGGGIIGYLAGGAISSMRGNENSTKNYAIGTNNVPNNGLYYLHEGEAVVPKNENNSGNITVAPVYYVNVSDKAEFQKMLNDSNRQLVAEITRSVKV